MVKIETELDFVQIGWDLSEDEAFNAIISFDQTQADCDFTVKVISYLLNDLKKEYTQEEWKQYINTLVKEMIND